MEALIPVTKAMVLKEENLAREEDIVPTAEAEVLVQQESVAPKAESLGPEEGILLRLRV